MFHILRPDSLRNIGDGQKRCGERQLDILIYVSYSNGLLPIRIICTAIYHIDIYISLFVNEGKKLVNFDRLWIFSMLVMDLPFAPFFLQVLATDGDCTSPDQGAGGEQPTLTPRLPRANKSLWQECQRPIMVHGTSRSVEECMYIT